MFARRKSEVLVVGAGPVGLFTALALNARGVPVRILERGRRSGQRSYALALHPETLRLFEPFSLFEPVLARARRVRRAGLYEGAERRAELRISEVGEDHSFLAILPQSDLEELLIAALQQRGIKVQWNHSVHWLSQDDDGVDVTVDRLSQDTVGYSVQHSEWVVAKTTTVRAPWVIGADGHGSVVRRALEIDFPTVGPTQEFDVFEFDTDADLGDEVRIGLEDKTTNVCWPLPDRACRFGFERAAVERGRDTREKDRDGVQLGDDLEFGLDDDRLRRLLATRMPWFTGKVGTMHWRMHVRFEQRLAERIGRGRAWLVGDAAHLTGPLGVQSMNVGFREALRLAEAIATGMAGGDAGSLLTAAEQDCLREWRLLLGCDELLRLGPSTSPWVARRRQRLLPSIPASGAGLLRLAGQLGLEPVDNGGRRPIGAAANADS